MFPIGRIYGSGTQEQEVGVSLFTIPLSDQLVEFVLHITLQLETMQVLMFWPPEADMFYQKIQQESHPTFN